MASIALGVLFIIANSAANSEIKKDEFINPSSIYLVAVKSPLEFKLSLREYLIRESVIWGVNPNLAVRIVECESGFKPYVQNKQSSAYGLFQFLNSSWSTVQIQMNKKLDREDPYDQIEAGLFWLKKSTSPWNESKFCWG